MKHSMVARKRTLRQRGSALITFVFALILVLAVVGLAFESAISVRRTQEAAAARVTAREAAEAGAARSVMALRALYTSSTGFSAALTASGGHLGWAGRQSFGLNATWYPLVVNNDDTASGGNATTDTDSTVLLYVTGRAPAATGGDAIYTLAEVVTVTGGQSFPALYIGTSATTANLIAGVALGALDFRASGQNGGIRVDSSLLQAVGTITATDLTYGSGYVALLGSANPAPHLSTVSPGVPSQTSADAWNAAKAAGGNNYLLTSFGEVQDASGNRIASSPWSGWLWTIAAGWVHAAGNFAPGNVPATFYGQGSGLSGTITILGGNTATASFLSQGSVIITGTSVSLTPLNGVSIFADQDVVMATTLSGINLGTTAAPGYVVAGEQVLLDGTLGTVQVQGAVVAKNTGNVSLTVNTSTVLGSVRINQPTTPGFNLGQPTIGTACRYEALSDTGVTLPTDAAQGSLGVYR